MTIIHVNQGYLNDISGYTVGEVKGIFEASELELDKKAKAEGWNRTKLSPWMRVFQADERPPCPWGNEQYVADANGVLGQRQVNWDSSGQSMVEYAVLCGAIALALTPVVIILGQLIGGS